jgi:hypothetical protein
MSGEKHENLIASVETGAKSLADAGAGAMDAMKSSWRTSGRSGKAFWDLFNAPPGKPAPPREEWIVHYTGTSGRLVVRGERLTMERTIDGEEKVQPVELANVGSALTLIGVHDEAARARTLQEVQRAVEAARAAKSGPRAATSPAGASGASP